MDASIIEEFNEVNILKTKLREKELFLISKEKDLAKRENLIRMEENLKAKELELNKRKADLDLLRVKAEMGK